MAKSNGSEVALSFSADMYKKLFPAEYMRKCLVNKVRPDSRSIEATRAVQLQTDVIQTAASSSLVKLGKTSVLTAIKLAVGTPAVDTPDQGEIAIHVHLSPLCSNRFTVGRPSEEAQSIGSQLTRIIVGSRVVEMESLSIVKGQSAWKLMVDVYCVDHDGNVLDAALTSIIAALKTLKLPATSVNEADNVSLSCQLTSACLLFADGDATPLRVEHGAYATSFAVVDGEVLIDPTSDEEDLASTAGGSILAPNVMQQCMAIAKRNTEALAKLMDASPSRLEATEQNKKRVRLRHERGHTAVAFAGQLCGVRGRIIVRDGTAEPHGSQDVCANNGILPTTMTPRMIRIATVAGLLVAVSYYIIGGAMLSTTVQGVDVATTETTTAAAASLREVDHAEVKEVGRKASRRQRAVPTRIRSPTREAGDDTMGGVFLPVLLPFWPFALICIVVLVVLRLIDGPLLDYYVWYTRAPMQIDDRTPLLLWLNGGPGASSMTGLLTEMGPYRLTKERKLIPHEHSWTNIGHMLFFDQPVGTGYSSEEGAEQLYRGLQGFFRRHPEYKHNPLYVCGESYAGKYAPSVSHYIHVKNSGPPDNDDVVINLTGVAIGNGDMWPVLQTRSVPDFAIALGLIDSQQYEDANAQISVCEELHRQGRDVDAFQVCQAVTQKIYEAAGNPFIYDIRQSSNTFTDLSTLLSSYFNDDAVRRALNVPPGTPWTSVDGSVYGTSSSAPALDEMLDVPINVFRDLLDNYKFLFYAGNMDGSLCNNLGVGRIIDRLAWTDTAKYRVAKRQPWMVDGQVAGLAKSAGNMSYVVVLNSGHLVPADQPEASLDMMRRFVNNEPFFTLSP
ncbi:Alpha/Beta hydrolase fold [Phytophthora cactorum]|nr:Alpha/Beta hydrolase fold [Phytophthora cactorum]